MKAALIKLIKILLTSDKKVRSGALILILSIVAGTLGLLFLPVAVLRYSGEGTAQVSTVSFDREAFRDIMDENMLTQGEQIAAAMDEAGLREQTLKAQLLYISCFETVLMTDFAEYAALFSEVDDATLIANLNKKYGLQIDLDIFLRSYTWVLHQTINPYLFANPDTKNAADLAAWARNAYLSGWAFADGAHGERNANLGYRTTDDDGLLLGYLNYLPSEKVFSDTDTALQFSFLDSIETLPEAAGVVLNDLENYGVYLGNGEVIYASSVEKCVVRENISQHDWLFWCTVSGVQYSQEVLQAVAEIEAELILQGGDS